MSERVRTPTDKAADPSTMVMRTPSEIGMPIAWHEKSEFGPRKTCQRRALDLF